MRTFKVMDKVFVRDFRVRHVKWMPGVIVKVTGPVSYQVRVSTGVVRRHVDGIRLRYSEDDSSDTEDTLEEIFDSLWWPAPGAEPAANPPTPPTPPVPPPPSPPVAPPDPPPAHPPPPSAEIYSHSCSARLFSLTKEGGML